MKHFRSVKNSLIKINWPVIAFDARLALYVAVMIKGILPTPIGSSNGVNRTRINYVYRDYVVGITPMVGKLPDGISPT